MSVNGGAAASIVNVTVAPGFSPYTRQAYVVPAGATAGEQPEAPNAPRGGANASYCIAPSPPSALSSFTSAATPPGSLSITTAYCVSSLSGLTSRGSMRRLAPGRSVG